MSTINMLPEWVEEWIEEVKYCTDSAYCDDYERHFVGEFISVAEVRTFLAKYLTGEEGK